VPIYEYECLECGHRFEYLVLSKSPAAQCPACQKSDLKQLISLCGISSETIREANLSAVHRKNALVQKDKAHEEHKENHAHFND